MVKRPAIRYHGSKFRLADWVMSFFPAHKCYVEPFGGAAGVLLQKERCYAEVYNDLDGEIVNFFRVLQNPEQRKALFELLILTPYAREEFQLAWCDSNDPIERARRLCIRAEMGFGSGGATMGNTGFRVDTKRDYGTAQHLWADFPNKIETVAKRFSGVLIENKDAVEVMKAHDTCETLHYVDPPYVHETRVMAGRSRTYKHELTNEQHIELLSTLKQLKGMVLLSGYPSDLYQSELKGWRFETKQSRISAGRGTALRDECLWINPAADERLRNYELSFMEQGAEK